MTVKARIDHGLGCNQPAFCRGNRCVFNLVTASNLLNKLAGQVRKIQAQPHRDGKDFDRSSARKQTSAPSWHKKLERCRRSRTSSSSGETTSDGLTLALTTMASWGTARPTSIASPKKARCVQIGTASRVARRAAPPSQE